MSQLAYMAFNGSWLCVRPSDLHWTGPPALYCGCDKHPVWKRRLCWFSRSWGMWKSESTWVMASEQLIDTPHQTVVGVFSFMMTSRHTTSRAGALRRSRGGFGVFSNIVKKHVPSVSTSLVGINQWDSDAASAIDIMWRKRAERRRQDWVADCWHQRRDEDETRVAAMLGQEKQKSLFKVIRHGSVTALWRQTLCSLGGKCHFKHISISILSLRFEVADIRRYQTQGISNSHLQTLQGKYFEGLILLKI